MKLTAAIALAAALIAIPAAAQTANERRQLDAAVSAAIARGDFRHAREMAVTAEHWQWISEAQSNSGGSGKSRASSQECKEARRSYEVAAGMYKRSRSEIAAKRESVRVACGSILY